MHLTLHWTRYIQRTSLWRYKTGNHNK